MVVFANCSTLGSP